MGEIKENDMFYVLIGKEINGGNPVLVFFKPLIEEYSDLLPMELPRVYHLCVIFSIALIWFPMQAYLIGHPME